MLRQAQFGKCHRNCRLCQHENDKGRSPMAIRFARWSTTCRRRRVESQMSQEKMSVMESSRTTVARSLVSGATISVRKECQPGNLLQR